MDNSYETQQINRFNIIANTFYLAVILVIFSLHYLEESNSPILTMGLFFVSSLTYGLVYLIYIRNGSDPRVKYYLAVAFFITYFYVMIVGNATFRFTLIFPPLALMILYHSSGFMLGLGIATILVNVLNVFVCYYVFDRVDFESISRYVIQLITIILTLVASYVATRIYARSFNHVQEQNKQLEKMSLQTVETIANTIDAKDAYTEGHSRRVAEYSMIIAERMGLDKETKEKIGNIAFLHDVGKIAVPDTVLNKPSRLSDEEYELMKTHTTAGAEILKDIDSMPDIVLGARYHHERYDGKGYPDGLKGEEIPLIARIIGLADAFDAMTSNRVYRPSLTKEVVLEQIEKGRGTQFDPKCVDVFMDYAKNADVYLNPENPEANNNVLELHSLTEDSDRDELTGAYNRLYGEKQLSLTLTRDRGALVLIDIVGLKKINMEYGFRRGDYLLKLVSDCIRVTKLDNYEIPYIIRFDGNEFLVFLYDYDKKEKAKEWINAFLTNLKNVGENGDFEDIGLNVSCAITIHDNLKKDITTHVRELYQSLYFLKNSGSNKEYFIYEDKQKEGDIFFARDDIEDLITLIKSQDPYTLTSIMGDRDITKTLSVLIDEGSENAAIILFTAKPDNPYLMSIERRQHVMALLDDAIAMTIGESGFLSSYSSLQRIVFLNVPASNILEKDEYINGLENKVLSLFHKNYDRFDMEIKCSYSMLTD